ncbi:MAG: helix-turn-helix domain-containing protein [Rhizobium sp.]|nr:helix-turn-helix domain-containing protein [Rhizobium sp.]
MISSCRAWMVNSRRASTSAPFQAEQGLRISTRLVSFLRARPPFSGQSTARPNNQHRCERAKRLLAGRPEATVADIQFECGFSSKSSFYAAFRKCTGMTPVEYRRRRQADGPPAP